MRSFKVSLSLLIILLTVFGASSIAFAADVFHFKGETAEASFYTSDATYCIVTSIYLYANNGRSQDPPGRPQPSSYAYVSVHQYDICNAYQPLFSGSGYSIPIQGSFNARPTLDQASLSATIQIYDYVSASYRNVSIDVVWTGGDSTSQGRFVSRSEAPGYRFMSRSTGTYRAGEAAGTISIGTGNLTNGQPAYYAALNSSKSGSVTVSN